MKQRFYFYFFETTVFKALNTGPWRSVVTEKGQVGPKQSHVPSWSLWLWSGVCWWGPRDTGGPPELEKQSCGSKGTTSQHLDFTGPSTWEARDQGRSPEAHRAEPAGVCQNRPAQGPSPAARRVRSEHVCPPATARGGRLGEAPP